VSVVAYVNGQWVPEDASVSGQVAKLSSQDSAIMQQATASGQRAANARGLSNSSMGIGAGISSALGAITPIASADAANIQQENVANEQLKSTQEVAAAQIAQADRTAYANASSSAASTYTQGIGATLQNENIGSDTRNSAQQDMANLYSGSKNSLAAIYGVSPGSAGSTAGLSWAKTATAAA
jgi:hypothetical protein